MRTNNRNPAKPRRKNVAPGMDRGSRTSSRREGFYAAALETTPDTKGIIKSDLKAMMDPRLKYTLLEATLAADSVTGTTGLRLCGVSQGTADNQRIGDRIRVKRFEMSGKVFGNASSTTCAVGRVIVVFWPYEGPSAVNVPIASQIVQGGAGYLPYAAYSRDWGEGVRILYDAKYSILPISTANECDLFHIDIPVDLQLQYAAASTYPVTGDIMVFFISDVTTNQPSINFQSTCWFTNVQA